MSMPRFTFPDVGPDVARSIFGIFLLVLGSVTLIALVLPGQGTLTSWWEDTVGPWFGSMRWMLPFLLIGGGWYLEWGPGKLPRSGWAAAVIGIGLTYVSLLGMVAILRFTILEKPFTGGSLGKFAAALFAGLIPPQAAFIVLGALAAIGLLVGFGLHPRDLTRPIVAFVRWLAGMTASAFATRASTPGSTGQDSASGPAAGVGGRSGGRGGARPVVGAASSPGQTGLWGRGSGGAPAVEDAATVIPSAVPSLAPVSATFAPARAADWAGTSSGGATAVGPSNGTRAGAPGVPRPIRPTDDITDISDSPPTRERIAYSVPPITLLEDVPPPVAPGGEEAHHRRNEEIIVRKLGGFGIVAQIVGRNAGPVVTQYEVQPAPDVKVSRIEALADDLAMALAARSLRIEAPIPGKSAVGIEIPNKDFNVVGLRGILESVDIDASGSKLTFALGRDVAGKAQAVDLAKMPHLLIAGATGSGKSVMVNALITSLLCEATPDDVRMILVDLKRVELAAYNGLPHLLVPVITEPERAKAALKWAVNEMEGRYRRFAGASVRNIRGYNESRADTADRLPSIVLIVDELADLMMREGKNVEEPIVRLAQKARATGIHMVLATQRPSVNVVTGLIKANFPSRIAFAMASQIDSRTILDSPGAEDLIGRGDMLYQPADLPRPMRLQGVFVSDAEINAVTGHWRDQIDNPHYDLSIIESDEDGAGTADDLADADADRLLGDAVEVIREYDRASASLLQRRLKVGYARAARIIDQLEARGYIGPFDGSNARQVFRRDGAGAAGNRADVDEGDDV
jgi:FtsK/SpoIIIE family/FtsK alpha domain/Ftsk gamma domain